MMPWQIWLQVDIDRVGTFGAVGPHACASVGAYFRELPLAEVPAWMDGPTPGIPGVVAVDAPLLAEDPSATRLVPDGAGCLLVAPDTCPDDAIDAARTALGARPAWTALCRSAVEGEFGRPDPYGAVILCADAAARLVAVALDCPEVLAQAGAQHRDALLCAEITGGADDAAAGSGRALGDVLRDQPGSLEARGWHRVHAAQVLQLCSPLCPAFQAVLDRLPRDPDGPLPVQVIAAAADVPAEDPRTLWRAIRLDWLARRAPHKRTG